jgi:hypothetical protein
LEKPGAILWIEASGFSFLIVMCWLSELFHLPHYVLGELYGWDWRRVLIRTASVVVIWIWVHFLTRRILKRLHHLEEFLRVCSWCRKVCHEGEWMDMEKYFKSRFATKTSHGMCPECLQKKKDELALGGNPAAGPE